MENFRKFTILAVFLTIFLTVPNLSFAIHSEDDSKESSMDKIKITNDSVKIKSSASSIEDLQLQINSLLKLIQELQNQLNNVSKSAIPAIPGKPNNIAATVPATPPAKICKAFRYNLYLGLNDSDTEGEITELQEFLSQDSEIYPEGLITGFFGPLTEIAIKKWQAKMKIVSSGSPDTTGYGVVGPKTRAKLKINTKCAIVSEPKQIDCDPMDTWKSDDGCNICSCSKDGKIACTLKYCSPPSSENKPPVIYGISGSTYLSVNQTANWTIKANDPENGPLSYSVIWGDENDSIKSTGSSETPLKYIQKTSFSHTYSIAGIYYPTFTVTDNKGASAKTSISVKVGAVSTETGSIKITVKDNDIICAAIIGTNCGVIDAKVSIYSDNGSFVDSEYTKIGIVLFEDLPVGTYIAYVSADGYEEKKDDFKIEKNIGGYLTIYLKKKSEENHNPEITETSTIPSEIKPGESVNFSWNAKDADNDDLSWSVNWGDGTGMETACQSPNPKNGQGWVFEASHSWEETGVGAYVVNVTVSDCNSGSDSQSFNVKITGDQICTSFDYSDWSDCQISGTQERTVISKLPEGCIGGDSIITQSCVYIDPGNATTTTSQASYMGQMASSLEAAKASLEQISNLLKNF